MDFKARTDEGYYIRILSELLHVNLGSTAHFNITPTGIVLRMIDPKRIIMINMSLEADQFQVFKLGKKSISIGINLKHFYNMLKPLKKRDSVELYIETANPTELGIRCIPKDTNRVTTSAIKIQNVQSVDIDVPEGYSCPINLNSQEFCKMCKGLAQVSQKVHVIRKGSKLLFNADSDGVFKRSTEFGDEDEGNDPDEKTEDFDDFFATENMSKITKMYGLHTKLQIYTKTGLPVLFRTNIGSLGKIAIYLKSLSLQEADSRPTESDEEN